jgi:uncharacterized protein (DUF4415 family)
VTIARTAGPQPGQAGGHDLADERARPIGRPPVEHPKVQIGFRLSQDVVDRIRASGPGYNAKVEKVLRKALDAGRF